MKDDNCTEHRARVWEVGHEVEINFKKAFTQCIQTNNAKQTHFY